MPIRVWRKKKLSFLYYLNCTNTLNCIRVLWLHIFRLWEQPVLVTSRRDAFWRRNNKLSMQDMIVLNNYLLFFSFYSVIVSCELFIYKRKDNTPISINIINGLNEIKHSHCTNVSIVLCQRCGNTKTGELGNVSL